MPRVDWTRCHGYQRSWPKARLVRARPGLSFSPEDPFANRVVTWCSSDCPELRYVCPLTMEPERRRIIREVLKAFYGAAARRSMPQS